MDNTIKNILIVFLLVLVFYLMSVLSYLLIPLVLAFLSAILFQPLVNALKKLKFPDWIIMPIVVVITLGIIYGLFNLILETGNEIASQKDYLFARLDYKVSGLISWINGIAGQRLDTQNITNELSNLFDSKWVSSRISVLASSIGSFTSSFFMFALYYIVLLSGLSKYESYLNYVGTGNQTLISTYKKVQKSIFRYVIIKSLINIANGGLIYLLCLAFGIKFAIFWGFLAFLLTFIPSIGSSLAIVFPAIMGIIQYDSLQLILFSILCLAIVPFVIGNFLEPKIFGNRLSLNTLTVIFGLVFWGYLWGIAGMVLSVPLLVIIKILFEHIPSLSIVSRIMGKVNIINEAKE